MLETEQPEPNTRELRVKLPETLFAWLEQTRPDKKELEDWIVQRLKARTQFGKYRCTAFNPCDKKFPSRPKLRQHMYEEHSE